MAESEQDSSRPAGPGTDNQFLGTFLEIGKKVSPGRLEGRFALLGNLGLRVDFHKQCGRPVDQDQPAVRIEYHDSGVELIEQPVPK